jgi:hypothetical protein
LFIIITRSLKIKVNSKKEGSLPYAKKLTVLTLLLVGFAMLGGFDFDMRRGSADKPVPMKSSPLNRQLKNMQEHLKAYKNEIPLGNGSRKTSVPLGIFSSNIKKYKLKRKFIRDTYLGIDDPRLCKLSEYIRQMEANPQTAVCQVPYTFIIAAGGSDRPFDHDDSEPLTVPTYVDGTVDPEDDCTFLNIRENMEDGKSATYFKFGASIGIQHSIDYIVKLDDDTLLSPELLLQFIEDDLPPAPLNRRIYGGRGWMTRSKSILYGAGQFYFMSTDLAHYVGNVLTAADRKAMTHNRKTEDADMGVFVFSHPRPIKFINMAKGQIWRHQEMKKEEAFRKAWKTRMRVLPLFSKALPWNHFCIAWGAGEGL